jgi:2-polyprenyl-3-methyl-5-hydroxy-6-metoxy-1,4-benzoquinol methylase
MPLRLAELLGPQGAAPLADEALFVALLQSKIIHDLELERLLTALRRALLEHAIEGGAALVDDDPLEFFCALAQQCFLNEYVFALGDNEQAQSRQIHDRIVAAIETGTKIAPLDLVVAASYRPLHKMAVASSLLDRQWPSAVGRLLTQQIREPFEEAARRENIPVLTRIDDAVSLQVQNQYEENPYPRWTITPPVKPTTIGAYLRARLGVGPPGWTEPSRADILIAGCGTGSHSIDTARRFPQSHVLAIDISRTSLAYADRKAHELDLANIEHARADILKLDTLDRRFNVIETAGVLHHLADPAAGWRLLLSLLRPNGLMFVGLYSALARRSLTAARAQIAECGYRATADDIRLCRQDLIARSGMPSFRDFSSTSGCRDLLFNVMEHQFTIPQIADFLASNRLTFLGFEQLLPDTLEKFRQLFPHPSAVRDLTSWHRFEERYPYTFSNMYFFWVQKRD